MATGRSVYLLVCFYFYLSSSVVEGMYFIFVFHLK